MNSYVTGQTVRRLREAKNLTQSQLAEALGVTAKAVSRWETGRGLPDISLLSPLSATLGVSVMELMSGSEIINRNVSCNLLRTRFYVCPVCGNILHAAGDALISCCGITLPPLEAEPTDDAHHITIETVEDEHFLTVDHPMEKDHFISFMAWITGDRVQLIKLYPEGNAETRISLRGFGKLYLYCNRHGLMTQKIR